MEKTYASNRELAKELVERAVNGIKNIFVDVIAFPFGKDYMNAGESGFKEGHAYIPEETNTEPYSGKVNGINMDQEEVGRTLENLATSGVSKEVVSKMGVILTYANDKGYFRFPNGKTIIDYQDDAIKMQIKLGN